MITALVKKPSKLVQTLCCSASRFQFGGQTVAGERIGISLNLEGRRSLFNKSQNLCKCNVSTLVKDSRTDHLENPLLESFARGTLLQTFLASASHMTSSFHSGILTGSIFSGTITNKPVYRTHVLLRARLPNSLHGRWLFSSAKKGAECPRYGCIAGRESYCSPQLHQKAEYSFRPSFNHSQLSAYATGSSHFNFLMAAFISLTSFGLVLFGLYFARLLFNKSRLPFFMTKFHSDSNDGEAAERPGHEANPDINEERDDESWHDPENDEQEEHVLVDTPQDDPSSSHDGNDESKKGRAKKISNALRAAKGFGKGLMKGIRPSGQKGETSKGESKQEQREIAQKTGNQALQRPVDNPKDDEELDIEDFDIPGVDEFGKGEISTNDPSSSRDGNDESKKGGAKKQINSAMRAATGFGKGLMKGIRPSGQKGETSKGESKQEQREIAHQTGNQALQRPVDNPKDDEELDIEDFVVPGVDEFGKGEISTNDPSLSYDGNVKRKKGGAQKVLEGLQNTYKGLKIPSRQKGETSKGKSKQEKSELPTSTPASKHEEVENVDSLGDFSDVEEVEIVETPQGRAPDWDQESGDSFSSAKENTTLLSDDEDEEGSH